MSLRCITPHVAGSLSNAVCVSCCVSVLCAVSLPSPTNTRQTVQTLGEVEHLDFARAGSRAAHDFKLSAGNEWDIYVYGQGVLVVIEL